MCASWKEALYLFVWVSGLPGTKQNIIIGWTAARYEKQSVGLCGYVAPTEQQGPESASAGA
jgi:hypothetical protein